MADRAISELIAANQVTPTDLFVLEQSGTAKKLTGQILENWLLSFADGHGGIQSIAKINTSGLVDTYRITLADTTTFDFVVTNGKGVTSIEKTGTSGLVDTYTIAFNDNTYSTFTVTNGAKGDKGDNQYVWIKYASQKPTGSSHSFGDVADNWIGIYSGASETAPTDWQEYEWFQIKGDKGDTGAPATVISNVVEYQAGDSGTVIPSGAWSASVPVVTQGRYLWTRTTTTFNSGTSAVSYSVSRMGIDGTGSVSAVAGISPDPDGNVPLTADDIGALSDNGGDLTGELRMNGQPISGLNPPTADDHAANMGFVNQQVKKAAPRNLLDNSDFTNPVNQRGQTSYTPTGAERYTIDRWIGLKNTNVYVVNGGIEISPNATSGRGFKQILENPSLLANKVVTFVVKFTKVVGGTGVYINDGEQIDTSVSEPGVFLVTKKISSNVNSIFVQIGANGSTDAGRIGIEWAALYEGEYTLETLPEYRTKGYAAELAECQRYAITGLDVVEYSPLTNYDRTIFLPTQLRIPGFTIEIISMNGAKGYVSSHDGTKWVDYIVVQAEALGQRTVRLCANVPNNTVVGFAVNAYADL